MHSCSAVRAESLETVSARVMTASYAHVDAVHVVGCVAKRLQKLFVGAIQHQFVAEGLSAHRRAHRWHRRHEHREASHRVREQQRVWHADKLLSHEGLALVGNEEVVVIDAVESHAPITSTCQPCLKCQLQTRQHDEPKIGLADRFKLTEIVRVVPARPREHVRQVFNPRDRGGEGVEERVGRSVHQVQEDKFGRLGVTGESLAGCRALVSGARGGFAEDLQLLVVSVKHRIHHLRQKDR
eukprot:5763024-Prymnesium_polylepis.2